VVFLCPRHFELIAIFVKTKVMKQLILFFVAFGFSFIINAQESAASVVVYGEVKDKGEMM